MLPIVENIGLNKFFDKKPIVYVRVVSFTVNQKKKLLIDSSKY